MTRVHSWEVRDRAETFYVTEGMCIPRIAALLGVSVSVVTKWSSASKWAELRREYRHSLAEIRRNTTRLRQRLVEKALESLDPHLVNAVARMETTVARERAGDAPSFACTPEEGKRDIETPAQAAEALRDAVEKKLNILLGQPDAVSLKAVKELIAAIRLLESMKSVRPAETPASESSGLSSDTADEIRRKILGLREEG